MMSEFRKAMEEAKNSPAKQPSLHVNSDVRVASFNEALKDYVAWVVKQPRIRPRWYQMDGESICQQVAEHFNRPVEMYHGRKIVVFKYAGYEFIYTDDLYGRFSIEENY